MLLWRPYAGSCMHCVCYNPCDWQIGKLAWTFFGILLTLASTTTFGHGNAARSLFLALMLPLFSVDLTSLSEMCLRKQHAHSGPKPGTYDSPYMHGSVLDAETWKGCCLGACDMSTLLAICAQDRL